MNRRLLNKGQYNIRTRAGQGTKDSTPSRGVTQRTSRIPIISPKMSNPNTPTADASASSGASNDNCNKCSSTDDEKI